MKFFAVAVCAIAGAALLAACSGKKSAETDTVAIDSAMTEIAEPNADADSLNRIFKDDTKKSNVATDSTYAVTASGLRYIIVKKGTGATPTATDNVTVHYTGQLTNGTVFDSSVTRGEPATFPLNGVIPGWTEGLQLMKEGGEAIFYIPSSLAYGENGIPGVIPPAADLIFTVQLLKVEK